MTPEELKGKIADYARLYDQYKDAAQLRTQILRYLEDLPAAECMLTIEYSTFGSETIKVTLAELVPLLTRRIERFETAIGAIK